MKFKKDELITLAKAERDKIIARVDGVNSARALKEKQGREEAMLLWNQFLQNITEKMTNGVLPGPEDVPERMNNLNLVRVYSGPTAEFRPQKADTLDLDIFIKMLESGEGDMVGSSEVARLGFPHIGRLFYNKK